MVWSAVNKIKLLYILDVWRNPKSEFILAPHSAMKWVADMRFSFAPNSSPYAGEPSSMIQVSPT